MNLFIKIKKIISCVLLLCVLVSIIPVQVFAQTASPAVSTPTTSSSVDMSAYAGWGNVKSTSASVPKSKYANGVTAPWLTDPLFGNYVQLSDVQLDNYGHRGGSNDVITDDYYFALADATGGLKNPNNKGKPYEQSKISVVGTNSGKVAYFYKAESGDPVLIAYATKGKVTVPYQGKTSEGYDINYVTKDLSAPNPNNTDIKTQQGFLNANDNANGNEIGSSQQLLVNVEQLDTLRQQQETIDAEVERLKKLRDADDAARNEDASNVLSTEERAKLESDIALAEKAALQNKKDVASGDEASKSNELSLAECKLFEFNNQSCIIIMSAIFANIALKLSAFVLYWTGNLFDYSIEIAVNSAEFLKKLGVIEPTWAFVRDTLNMTFIFILLFVAVQILLGKGSYTARGSIIRLVLVAIFMNFSLFAAKALVDGSNIISLNIYESIKAKDAGSTNRGSVSARIMTTLGLSGVYNFSAAFDNKTIEGCGTAPATILTVGIFGTILLIITSLTFLLAAILFFLRMLNIIVLFISSPFWIWGYVMQGDYFKRTSTWWWNNMWHVVKFPVIYMLMLYVSLAMFAQLNTAQKVLEGGERMSFIKLICDTSASGNADTFAKLPLILNFIIVIACLIGIIKYSAQNAGKEGALGTGKLATNFSNKIDGMQKRFTTGAAQGVYNKSRDAAVGIGNGAREMGKKAKDATLTIAKDTIRSKVHSYNKEVGDSLAAKAASGQYTERQSERLAVRADKLRNRKIFGETEDEAIKRRTAPILTRAQTFAKVQAAELKPESEKAWKKKNVNGTRAQYEEYVEKKVELMAQSHLGDLRHKVEKTNPDGSTVLTEDLIRKDIYDTAKDKDGNDIKVLNQEKLLKNIQDSRKFHTDSGDMLKQEKSKRIEILSTERAKVRLQAAEETLKASRIDAGKKQSKVDSLKKKKQRLDELNKKLKEGFPDLNQLDLTKVKEYDSEVASYLRQSNIIKRKGQKEIRNAQDTQEEMRARNEMDTDLSHLEIEAREKIAKKKLETDNIVLKLIDEIKTSEDEAE